MINKIVFDFGGVICDFKLNEYFSSQGYGSEDIEFITKNIFGGEEWQRGMDLGTLTLEEMRQKLQEKYSDKIDIINAVVDTDIKYIIPLRMNVIEYIKELREKGYLIYGLSNLSAHVHESFNNQYKGFDNLFDGITASYVVGAIKPASKETPNLDMSDTKIYDTFFRENHIKPSTALFIDDSEHNIRMGQVLGMSGIQWSKIDTLDMIKSKVNEAMSKSSSDKGELYK